MQQRPVLLRNVRDLRYGENAWQTARFIPTENDDPLGLDKFTLEAGSDPSLINLTDVDRGLHTLTHAVAALEPSMERGEAPDIALALKHGNLCGAGWGFFALENMIEGDLQAIFGASILLNFEVDEAVAEKLLYHESKDRKRRTIDNIAAPSVTPEAIKMLDRKEGRCRIFSNPALNHDRLNSASLDTSNFVRRVRGGRLEQSPFIHVLKMDNPHLEVYGKRTTLAEEDILFASAICRTTISNTVTLVSHRKLIGNGAGQTMRARAARLAIDIARENEHEITDSVAVSDSFFPFYDGPDLLVKAGVSAIFATSGSIRDEDTIKVCADANVPLYMLPDKDGRMFFHH